MVDLPLARHAKWIARACMALVVIAIVEQLLELFTDLVENPWLGVALGFLSAAAIGLDAIVVGVRRVKGEGPSIRNLAPGGWAMFGAMLWILAIPSYFFARRRAMARRTMRDDEIEIATYRDAPPMEIAFARVKATDWIAIVIVAAIGALAMSGVR